MSQMLYICGRQMAPGSLAWQVTRALEQRFGERGVGGGEQPDPAALAASDLVVALIDQDWRRRASAASWLDDPADLTRAILIAAAQDGKVILPLLLGGAAMPEVEDLPDELRFLHFRNAQVVGAGAAFEGDMARVIEALEVTRRGRGFGAQVGGAALIAGLWFALIFVLQLLAAFTPLGSVGVVAALFRSVRETSLIAFTPALLAALIFGARLLPQRRWLAATLLLLCAALMLEEMSRAGAITGYAPPWSDAPWIVAQVTRPALLALYVVALVTLLVSSQRSARLRYSHGMVMAQQRFREEAAAKEAGATRDIFVSCRPADMSATYRRLCAYVARYLTQDAREGRPLLQPAPVAGGYAGDAWQAALASSPDALVIIGPSWQAGLRDPSDPVRRQLTEALRAGKSLILALIDGAQPPTLAETPPELAALCFARPIRVEATRSWIGALFDDGYNTIVSRLIGVPGSYWGLLVYLVDVVFFNYSPDVFLSYRRADSATMCGRIYQALSRRSRLGGKVFRDSSAISAGVDFYAVLLSAIDASAVVLAVIGPQWLSLVGLTGARRLDDPEDMVRREIETALQDKKTLIPVLLDDTPMPTAAALPAALAPLAALTPMRVRSGAGFSADIARLTAETHRLLGIERHPALVALGALTALAAGAVVLINQRSNDFIAYLLQRNPQWCAQSRLLLCYSGPPDSRITSLLAALLLVACSGSATLYMAALWLMTRRRQAAWLLVLCLYFAIVALMAAGILAVFAGRLPAVTPLGTFGGASYSDLTVYVIGTDLLEASVIAALGLSWYFWRSQGKPGAKGERAT
jgi:hypothetical protein